MLSTRIVPGANWPVCGDHDRRFQVTLVDDLEQRRCGLARQRQGVVGVGEFEFGEVTAKLLVVARRRRRGHGRSGRLGGGEWGVHRAVFLFIAAVS